MSELCEHGYPADSCMDAWPEEMRQGFEVAHRHAYDWALGHAVRERDEAEHYAGHAAEVHARSGSVSHPVEYAAWRASGRPEWISVRDWEAMGWWNRLRVQRGQAVRPEDEPLDEDEPDQAASDGERIREHVID